MAGTREHCLSEEEATEIRWLDNKRNVVETILIRNPFAAGFDFRTDGPETRPMQ
jgi:hypothetical protein